MSSLTADAVMNAYDACRDTICANLDQYKLEPRYFTRVRKISAPMLIDFIVALGTLGLRAQAPWFYSRCGISYSTPRPDIEPSESAVEQQRLKLRPNAFADLSRSFANTVIEMGAPVKDESSEEDVHIHPYAADGTWMRYESTPELSQVFDEQRRQTTKVRSW